MPKTKLFLSLLTILLAVALVGGATMAWFTDADSVTNKFEAGTVDVEAERTSHSSKIIQENWNPGDCTELDICVENTGSKSINLRAKIQSGWLPSALRLLVVYTGTEVQLVAVEWDSTCKGCTGTEGPIATGKYSFSAPGPNSYMNGTFAQLDNEIWIQNGSGYRVWCVDRLNTISGTNDVKIYDPFCNENWYKEIESENTITVPQQWKNIPWGKLIYIINQKFLENGVEINEEVKTVEVMDIQQAIWFLIHSSFHSGGIHNDYDVDVANAIIADTNLNWELPTENVTFNLGADWQEGEDGWWYYKGIIPGTYSNPEVVARKICLDLLFCLTGSTTGNNYQGAQYWFTTIFEAVQSSNDASDDAWQMSYDGANWIPVIKTAE